MIRNILGFEVTNPCVVPSRSRSNGLISSCGLLSSRLFIYGSLERRFRLTPCCFHEVRPAEWPLNFFGNKYHSLSVALSFWEAVAANSVKGGPLSNKE